MFDSQKIDSYFDGRKNIDVEFETESKSGFSWRRFLKLGMPCLAAVFVGLMIIIPNIKKSVELEYDVTLPRKNEMEKLHVENTVFSITDDKNRVNTVVADSIEEVEPGSQKVRLTNPKGNLPTDEGEIVITADTGFFNQDRKILELIHNVKAVINDDSVVTTRKVVYDFNKEFGYSKDKVTAVGSFGKMQAIGFTYDKNKDLLTLKGHNELVTDKGTLTAENQTYIYRTENKVIAEGNAVVKHDTTKLNAQKIVAYFRADNRELEYVEAFDDVRIINPTETASGDEATYNAANGEIVLIGTNRLVNIVKEQNTLKANQIIAHMDSNQQIKNAIADGSVMVQTPKGTAFGDRGIYNPQNNTVELFGNVLIKQDENYIIGSHAISDLNTSISRITGTETSAGRVKGRFYKKGNGNENK